MLSFFKKVNSSHLFSFLFQSARVINVLSMLFFVPLFLNPIEQGYWFSFISLAALIIVADSGFSTIILQFAAHEFAHLKCDADNNIIGNEEKLNRLASFFVFSIKWIFAVVLIFMPIIFLIGYYVISDKNYQVKWFLSWLIYSFSSGLNFINNTILYFWEGCNFMAKSQKIRFLNVSASTIIMILFLMSGFKLYALAISLLLSSLFTLALIWSNYKKNITNFIKLYKIAHYPWSKDFFPLLGKYSISWISGYFILQMYTPVAFHFYGPIEAGKIGISITLCSGLLAFSNIWLYVVTPKINILISKREWGKLDILFFKNMLFSLGTFLSGLIFIFILFIFYGDTISILRRFMSIKGMFLLAFGWFFQLIVNSMAIYLRSHKEEPLVIPSLVSAIYIIISTYIISRHLSFDYMFLGFLTSYLFGLPWIMKLFRDKRKEHLNII